MGKYQVIIDSIEQKDARNYHVMLSVITSDGVRHWNARGAFFEAASEAELKTLIDKYGADHEAMVGADLPKPLTAGVAALVKPGKTVNPKTFAEEASIEAVAVADTAPVTEPAEIAKG